LRRAREGTKIVPMRTVLIRGMTRRLDHYVPMKALAS
jgi:hypothetical protein